MNGGYKAKNDSLEHAGGNEDSHNRVLVPGIQPCDPERCRRNDRHQDDDEHMMFGEWHFVAVLIEAAKADGGRNDQENDLTDKDQRRSGTRGRLALKHRPDAVDDKKKTEDKVKDPDSKHN